MFTGIIEAIGTVRQVEKLDGKMVYGISSPFTQQLQLGESIAHDGVCLTVIEIKEDVYFVTVIDTTLAVTNIDWQPGSIINLERAMTAGARLDGHIVQGHVDSTGLVTKLEQDAGSLKITVQIPNTFSHLIIHKGSICLNGISLTIVDVTNDSFRVAIIPHTLAVTNLSHLRSGDSVNLEFDVIGKYVARMSEVRY